MPRGAAPLLAPLPAGVQATPRNPLLKFGEALGLGSPSSQVGTRMVAPPAPAPPAAASAAAPPSLGWRPGSAAVQAAAGLGCSGGQPCTPPSRKFQPWGAWRLCKTASTACTAHHAARHSQRKQGSGVPGHWSHVARPVGPCRPVAASVCSRRTSTRRSRPPTLACRSATGQRCARRRQSKHSTSGATFSCRCPIGAVRRVGPSAAPAPARTPQDPPLKSRSGTPAYMAPEVIQQSYDERCDMWSAGIMMYQLLTGAGGASW